MYASEVGNVHSGTVYRRWHRAAEDAGESDTIATACQRGEGGGELPGADDEGGHEVHDCVGGFLGGDEVLGGLVGEALGGDVGSAGLGERTLEDGLKSSF